MPKKTQYTITDMLTELAVQDRDNAPKNPLRGLVLAVFGLVSGALAIDNLHGFAALLFNGVCILVMYDGIAEIIGYIKFRRTQK